MRPLFAGLAALVVSTPAYAGSLPGALPDVVFAGCVQSSENCVNATLSRNDAGVWNVLINATFDPGGGWIFSWFVRDTRPPIDDFSVQLEGPHFVGPAMPTDHVDVEMPNQPDFWRPTELIMQLFEPGRDTIVLTPDGKDFITASPTSLTLFPATETPEPTTLTLLASGIAAAAMRRRIRRVART